MERTKIDDLATRLAIAASKRDLVDGLGGADDAGCKYDEEDIS